MADNHHLTIHPLHFSSDATNDVNPLRPDAGIADSKHRIAMKDDPAFPL